MLLLISTWALARENPKAQEWLSRNSLSFTQNKGQVIDTKGNLRPDILYTANANGVSMYFRNTSVSYVFPKVEVDALTKDSKVTALYRMDLDFVGANTNARVVSEDAIGETSNYYLAHTPNGITGVQSYRKLVYKNIYDKIDLVFYTAADGKSNVVKYDFVVQPGGRVSDIKLRHCCRPSTRIA